MESSASLTETVTDNNGLTTTNRQAEFITQATVGVRASANSGRLSGYLDYSLSGLVYGRNTARNELQNSLSALATAELVQDHAYVDVAGSISQQGISVFGTQSLSSSVANPNRAEVSTFSVSPYVRGRLGSVAAYELRAAYANTHINSAAASDTNTASAQAQVSGGTGLTVLTWSAQLSHNEVDFTAGRRTEEDLTRGVLTWAITPELAVSAIGGEEANNYASLDKKSHRLYGASVSWRPSERTTLFAQREQRFFGESHSVAFAYRSARTALAYSASRGVSATPGQPIVGSVGTIFDLFYQLAASIQPDPVLRRQLVNTFLQFYGIDPTRQLLATFIASSLTLQRSQTLSLALLGLRNVVTITAAQSDDRRLDTFASVLDDFSNATVIRQRGLSVTWSHTLTPSSALSLTGFYQRATGSLDSQANSLKALTASWTNKLGRRTDMSLGARHSVFESATSPYDENAVYGTISMRF